MILRETIRYSKIRCHEIIFALVFIVCDNIPIQIFFKKKTHCIIQRVFGSLNKNSSSGNLIFTQVLLDLAFFVQLYNCTTVRPTFKVNSKYLECWLYDV